MTEKKKRDKPAVKKTGKAKKLAGKKELAKAQTLSAIKNLRTSF